MKKAKQSALAAADRESALPGAEDEASVPDRVIGDVFIIAHPGGDCKE